MSKEKKKIKDKLVRELSQWPRNVVAAVITWINNKTDYAIPSYGTKEQLLMGLEGVDSCVLEEALETILPDEDCDDDEEEDLDIESDPKYADEEDDDESDEDDEDDDD